MNVEQLRSIFPDEASCRQFFESVIWPDGPICPHCQGRRAWRLSSASVRSGLLECADCHRQFTVTTRTPFHSTKLSLLIWIQVMYSLICSSKGASSVAIATWVGISQKTAWKMMHALRALMAVHQNLLPMLEGIVELDEKYLGGKPRFQYGVKHKRGHGTAKACIATTVERQGPVKAHMIANNAVADLQPFVESVVAPSARLMSDEHAACRIIGRGFASHASVRHGRQRVRSRRGSQQCRRIVSCDPGTGQAGHLSLYEPPASSALYGRSRFSLEPACVRDTGPSKRQEPRASKDLYDKVADSGAIQEPVETGSIMSGTAY